MDGADEGRAAWLIDACAAAMFAAAAAFAGGWLIAPTAIFFAGAGGFALALLVLRSVAPEPISYSVSRFELTAWPEDVLELTELEPLLLDDPLIVDPGSRVVHLFPPPRSGRGCTACIDADPVSKWPGEVARLPVDGSAALRGALADLRRSLA